MVSLEWETAIQKMMWTEEGWLRMVDGSNLTTMEVLESSLPKVPMQKIPDCDFFEYLVDETKPVD